jgi:hypothetical protein
MGCGFAALVSQLPQNEGALSRWKSDQKRKAIKLIRREGTRGLTEPLLFV